MSKPHGHGDRKSNGARERPGLREQAAAHRAAKGSYIDRLEAVGDKAFARRRAAEDAVKSAHIFHPLPAGLHPHPAHAGNPAIHRELAARYRRRAAREGSIAAVGRRGVAALGPAERGFT